MRQQDRLMSENEDQLWEFVDRSVERLEQDWKDAGTADLALLVPRTGHPFWKHALLALIKVDQEYRWKSGERKVLEDYLHDWSDLASDRDAVKELLETECRIRAELDAAPTDSEIHQRFPELVGEVDLQDIVAEVASERHADAIRTVPAPFPTPDGGPSEETGTEPFPLAGQTMVRYEIRDVLGYGGMGAVYLAHDSKLDRDVALKVLRFDPADEPALVERFLREARTAANIRHPNICPIYDVGESGGTYYIAMALIEGRSLAEILEAGRLAPRLAAEIAFKLAGALQRVHDEGVIHRDIKPSNVMVDRTLEPLLMDFGLAHRPQVEAGPPDDADTGGASVPRSHVLTDRGALLGTPAYMAPEQASRKPADARTDVYSLGVLLYQMLTVRLPFDLTGPLEDPRQLDTLLERVIHEEPVSPGKLRPGLDSTLEAICLKAMAKGPADRYQSAAELAEALDGYLRSAPRTARTRKRKRLVAASVAAALLALAVGTAVYVSTGPRFQPATTVPQPTPPQIAELGIERWIEIDKSPIVGGMHVTPDGSTLTVAYWGKDNKARLARFDVASGKWLETVTLLASASDGDPTHGSFVFSPDGRYLYGVEYYGRELTRWDLDDDNKASAVAISDDRYPWPLGLAMSTDGRRLVVTTGHDGRSEDLKNDQVVVIDIAGGDHQVIGRVTLPDEPRAGKHGVACDSEHAYVTTYPRESQQPMLYEISLEPPCKIARSLGFSEEANLSSVAVYCPGRRLFVGDSAGRKIHVVDLETFKPVSGYELKGHEPWKLVLNRQQSLLVAVSTKSRVAFFVDPTDSTIVGRVEGLRRAAWDVAFSGDHRRIFITHWEPAGVAVVDATALFHGTEIVFASDRAGESYQIYRMAADGGSATRLTTNHATERSPRWSPDGCQIAFISDRQGHPHVCVMDRDGGNVKVFDKTDPSIMPPGVPFDWSPDGTKIAFVGDERRAIRILDLHAGTIRTALEGKAAEGYADHHTICWRTTDDQILFESQDPGSAYTQDIFQLDPHTGKLKQITHEGGRTEHCEFPAASPDGRRIAVSRTTKKNQRAADIYVMNGDGSGLARVSEAGGGVKVTPRWFAEGKRLVYSGKTGEYFHIDILDLNTGRASQVTRGQFNDVDPDVHGGALKR